ncbi:5096_t:CDS:2 [Entrophospora sp. SA101]|nr:5096_t:CDS:2 [Entrophospora sp. SA101]
MNNNVVYFINHDDNIDEGDDATTHNDHNTTPIKILKEAETIANENPIPYLNPTPVYLN